MQTGWVGLCTFAVCIIGALYTLGAESDSTPFFDFSIKESVSNLWERVKK